MKNYQKLKQIIREANLEKFTIFENNRKCINVLLTIRFADVMLAWTQKKKLGLTGAELDRAIYKLLGLYNFKDNNLDHQSEPTKDLLEKLLVKE